MAASRRGYAAAKRLLDLMVSVTLLVLLAPLFAIVAFVIKLDSPGPVIFKQERVGLGGKTFTMYKFRTMVHGNDPSIHREFYRHLVDGTAEARVDEEGEPLFLLDDPRVTRAGKILRKLSIDELPNLVNVLVGDMSLVGPRPPIPYEVELYDERAVRRLEVKPGMTGLAQVRGRGSLSFNEIIDYDLQYVDQRSFWLDLRILFETIPAVLTHRGV